ncbi:MAG: sodium:solute symporter family protein [Lachnospiraceae bacterium]|nr:sodium:solute symporter family protein [Lachnospiraceae bacterium]
MDIWLITGLVVTLVVIVGLSIWSGTKAKQGERSNSMPVVAGVIIGTLVGGSSTVGTAQLAYTYGMSAWWFTLGGGISCLILALVYAIPLRRSGCTTLVGMIRKEFGSQVGIAASVLSAVGTFINIISQLISATAVVAVIAPNLGIVPAVLFSALFMVLYVVFGGTKGAGMVGIVKTVLLYVAMMGCGVIVLQLVGGVNPFVEMVHGIDNPEGIHFFSLFARGVGTDEGACLSLILGVLTTQTYAQGVLSGRSDRDGRGGALISAFLIPPIGIGGILVGLYMRANAVLYPGVTEKTALTTFVTAHVPPLLAGVILGTLFIAVVGTGAGLALGISTIINNDIVKNVTHKFDDPKKAARLSKLWIVLVLIGACCLSTGSLGDTILQFAFMSMGLRGAVVFVPLLCALWLPGRVDPRFCLCSVIVSPILVLIFGIIEVFPFDSLFVGVLFSLLVCAAGAVHGTTKSRGKEEDTRGNG